MVLTFITRFLVMVLRRLFYNSLDLKPIKCFNVDSSEILEFLIRIILGLSHLADHKFRQNFQDCTSPICSCGQEIETSTHFLLLCSNYHSLKSLKCLYLIGISLLQLWNLLLLLFSISTANSTIFVSFFSIFIIT